MALGDDNKRYHLRNMVKQLIIPLFDLKDENLPIEMTLSVTAATPKVIIPQGHGDIGSKVVSSTGSFCHLVVLEINVLSSY